MSAKNKKRTKNKHASSSSSVGAAKSFKFVNKPAAFSIGRGGRSIIIKKTEPLIQVISQGGEWSPKLISLNPGSGGFSPWLQNVAQAFENYRCHHLAFHYEPTCPTTTTGAIVMGISHDATSSKSPSSQMLLRYESAAQSSLWNRTHVKATKLRREYYVHNGASDRADLRFNDFGVLEYGVDGFPTQNGDEVTLGTIWVDYSFELYNEAGDSNYSCSIIERGGADNTSHFFIDDQIVAGPTPFKTIGTNAIQATTSGIYKMDCTYRGGTVGTHTDPPPVLQNLDDPSSVKTLINDGYNDSSAPEGERSVWNSESVVAANEGDVYQITDNSFFNKIVDGAMSFAPVASALWDFLVPIVGFIAGPYQIEILYGTNKFKLSTLNRKPYVMYYVTEQQSIKSLLKYKMSLKYKTHKFASSSSSKILDDDHNTNAYNELINYLKSIETIKINPYFYKQTVQHNTNLNQLIRD